MEDSKQKAHEQKVQLLIGFSRNEKIGIGLLLFFIATSPIIFSQFSSIYSFETTGSIGDTIGGITAPFVNLLAAYLVYKSFTAQIRANAQQRQDHDEQMKQLNKEHSFSYINNLFTVIKEDYYNNRRVISNHFNKTKLSRSPIKFTYSNIISFEEEQDFRYEFNLGSYSQIPDGNGKKLNINEVIREPLQTIRHQLINLNMIVDEIKNNSLQIGMKNFYINEIQKILYDMDLWLILSENHIADIERPRVIEGQLNTEAFDDIKELAMVISEKGIIVRSPI